MTSTRTTPTVVLDLRMVEGRLHGIARYALELARRLPTLAPTWRFQGLTAPQGLPKDLGPLRPAIELIPCPARFLSPAEQPALAWSLSRLRPSLFHATSFSVPLLWPGGLVATLHDANHLALRENYGPGRVAYYRLVVGPRAKRAMALLTVSEFSRRELSIHLRLPEERFQVIPEGVASEFSPPKASAVTAYRRQRGLPARYLLAVGNPKPHKNLGVLHAVAERSVAPLVLLAGVENATTLGFPARTTALTSIPEAELPLLYAGASATLIPSRYEGFGLPALEAMAAGSPVLAAHAGALPEVVGEAGLLLPPDDVSAWTDAALRVLEEPGLRQRLVERGLARAARFNWDTLAQQTLAVYQRALERGTLGA